MKYEELKEELKIYTPEELKRLLKNNSEDTMFNIFQKINMRENSHTNLLAWLLKPKMCKKCDIIDKNSIQYHFICNFIEFLVDNEYLKGIADIKQYVEKLSDLQVVTQQHKNIDLLLYSKKQNFICVIENKLDAKICMESDGTTQLEKYKNYIEKEFANNFDTNKLNKIYFFLSSVESEKLEKKGIKQLLDNLGYEAIEHSDIVLMIYQMLKKIGNNGSAKMTKEDISKVLKSVIDKCTGKKNKQILQSILENIDCNKQNQEKTRNFNIRIDEILDNFLNEEKGLQLVLKILKQYITYWEKYNNFNSGYSKIIDVVLNNGETYGVYTWDIEVLKEKSLQ